MHKSQDNISLTVKPVFFVLPGTWSEYCCQVAAQAGEMEENRKGKWQREKQTGRKSTGELEGGEVGCTSSSTLL